MAENPYITKITLPSGTTYDLRDQGARDLIAGGVQHIIAWAGTAAPVVANIPEGVVVTYDGTSYTGTLKASAETAGKFYLVKSSTQKGTKDYYDEYITVLNGSVYSWEKLGDTQANFGTLAEKNSVTLNKSTAAVLGNETTATASASSVSFASHTKDKVLGADTTFAVTQPTISVVPATTNIKATASGTAIGANGTATALTGVKVTTQPTVELTTGATAGAGVVTVATGISSASASFASKDAKTVLTGVSATKKKLTTTTITPTGGTETVSKVTQTASRLVTTTVPNVTGNTAVSIPNVTGNTAVSIPNVTSVGSASSWAFTVLNNTLSISGGNGTAPTLGAALSASKVTLGTALSASKVTLGTAVTVATGAVASTGAGSAVVTGVSISDKTVAKAGTAVTVATGGLSETSATSNVGETVAVDAAGSGTASVIGGSATLSASVTPSTTNIKATASGTAVGADGTASVLTGVKVTAQPTIALATGATAGTGVISVATGISSATASGGAVSSNTNDRVDAITALGVGTAAAQTITINKSDVTVLKSDSDVVVQ